MSQDRRPLVAAMQAPESLDAESVREFITQERRNPEKSRGAGTTSIRSTLTTAGSSDPHWNEPRPTHRAPLPVGLIPVTVRLRPELAGALKRASLERQLAGESEATQQEIVASCLEPWLRARGYLG